jgi:hypothetical protein
MWSEFLPKLPHYFPKDCFGGSSDLAGTGSTLFSGGLFWRQLRFGRNHNKKPIQPHNCTGSDLAGTGSTLFSGGLFLRELKLSGSWHEEKISHVQEENSDSTRKFVHN